MKYLLKYEPEILDVGITMKLTNNYIEADKVSEIIDFIFKNKNKIKSYSIYEVKLFESNEKKDFVLSGGCGSSSLNIQGESVRVQTL